MLNCLGYEGNRTATHVHIGFKQETNSGSTKQSVSNFPHLTQSMSVLLSLVLGNKGSSV